MDEGSEQESQKRARAYAIWEQEGRPEGRHEKHWARAEDELRNQLPERMHPGDDALPGTDELNMSPSSADEYRERADECRAHAEKTKHDDVKMRWPKLAAQWQYMAEEADRERAERSVVRTTSLF